MSRPDADRPGSPVPYRQVRAAWDAQSITVYQAHGPATASGRPGSRRLGKNAPTRRDYGHVTGERRLLRFFILSCTSVGSVVRGEEA